jgi:hypothetical protein
MPQESHHIPNFKKSQHYRFGFSNHLGLIPISSCALGELCGRAESFYGSGVNWKTTGLSASGQQTRANGSSRQGNRPLKRSVVINGNIALNAQAHIPSGQNPSDTIQVRPTSSPEGHFPEPIICTISTRTAVPILSATLPP